jgi:hypothetical protein
MMDEREDRLDELIRDAARDFNAPPVTPRAEMWEAIRARRQGAPAEIRRFSGRRPLALVFGIAALLALGVAIGRLTVPQAAPAPVPSGILTAAPAPVTDGDTARSIPERAGTPTRRQPAGAPSGSLSLTTPASKLATGLHLTQVESFLTEFGTRPETGDYTGRARDLLADTRLLIDSKRVEDLRIQRLLLDLELVLAQIAALSGDRREDVDLIADAVAQRHLRTRLRSVLPTGPAIRS